MSQTNLSRRQALIAWTLCCIFAGSVFLTYALTSLTVGHGQYVMPLDDVYIHFQYAKQMALGQPCVYNPGQPPTSGATSFLYPFILAFGYLIGFQGLNLGIWAMAIGALALAVSSYLMVLLARSLNAPYVPSLCGAAIFALTGAVSWHFMSGMETGLVILFVFLTLYQFIRRDARGLAVSAFLLGLIRPEGSLFGVIGAVLMGFNLQEPKNRRWLLLPFLALGIQPLVNLLFTGSMVATGNQAKSILGMIPFYWDVVRTRILSNFTQMWMEVATGINPREGWYLPLGISLLALIGWLRLIRQRNTRIVGFLIIAWLLAGTAAVSTLDPAFWHFKRYQMPLIALFFPLASWGIGTLFSNSTNSRNNLSVSSVVLNTVPLWLIPLFILAMSLWTGTNFLRYYALNVHYVYSQPLQMARWLEANTSPDATIAVHDVGMMRYIGNRTTIDMVGLTTPGAADAWRNGPGSLAEFLIDAHPDYIAAYTSARGLGYLADTGIYNYGNALIEFPVTVDMSSNVALAAESPEVIQGIYQPDWSGHLETTNLLQPQVLSYVSQMQLVDSLNVGDLNSEHNHDYQWSQSEILAGFVSEVQQQRYVTCIQTVASCNVLDGGRNINGSESFTLTTRPHEDLVLVTRLHPASRGTYDLYVNGQFIDTNWIPDMAGRWLEAAFLVDSQYITDETTSIEIVPHTPNTYYAPYFHWAWQGDYRSGLAGGTYDFVSAYYHASEFSINITTPRLDVHDLNTVYFYVRYNSTIVGLDGTEPGHYSQGDYKFFLHIYADTSQPPIAQIDLYPFISELPGNMLPGRYLDNVSIDNLPPGQYQVAIGMYDAVTLQNLHPDSDGDELGRVFIGSIDIPEN